MKKIMMAVAGLILGACMTAQAGCRTETTVGPGTEAHQYDVQSKIIDVAKDGKSDVLSTPKVTVKAGEEGKITMGDEKKQGGDKAPAAGKLEEISAQPIPDKPAAGKVHGREFKVEKAILEEGCLKLRQGEGFATHLEEFEIDLSRKNVENFAGQTFTAELNKKAGIDITLAYSEEKKGSIKTRTYMREYTMKLEFGTAKDGKIPGKIHLRLPDEAGSFVVGAFEAEIK